MELSIFSKTDSEIPSNVSRQPKARAEEISFENIMKSASSLTLNSAESGKIAIKPDPMTAIKSDQTAPGITAANKDSDLQGQVDEKSSMAGKDIKENPLSQGLIPQNACVPNSEDLDVHPLCSPVETANDRPSANETKSQAPGSGKSSTKPDFRKTPAKAFEEAQTANISAPPPALSQNEQLSGAEVKSGKSPGIKRPSDAADNGEVSRKAEADINMGTDLNNADSSKQVLKRNENTGDALKGLSAAITKGDETLNSAHKANLKNLPSEKPGKEAPKANQTPLITKKQDSRGIAQAPASPRADELKLVNIDKNDSKESPDGSTPPVEPVTSHKDTKSFDGGKIISNRLSAGDEVKTKVDDGGSKAGVNSAVLDARTVNEPNASTGGQFNSKNEDNSGKKDLIAQTLKVTPGIGQANLNKISESQPSTEVRMAQSIKEGEVFDKVADGLKMSLAQCGKEVRLSLHPEHLGKLNIKLTVEDNAVKARIQVDNAAVKGILESDSGRLKEFFSHQGFTLEKYSVELNQSGNNAADNGGLNGDSWRNNENGGGPYARKDSRTEVLTDSRPYGDASDGAGPSGIDVFI